MQEITKEKFCEILERVRSAFDADSKIEEARAICKSDFLGSDVGFLSGEVLDLLALLINVSVEWFDMFCFECDFGRKDVADAVKIGFKYKNGELFEQYYDWSTIDKFYDFLMEMKNG